MSLIDPAERERKRRRHRNERIVASIIVLLAIAGTIALMLWKKRETETLRSDTRYIPKPFKITPEVTMLQDLVRIDSSKPEGVAAAARYIAAYLQRNGIRAELIESAPSMLNVYARIEGQEPGGGLMLFNHIDVVPAGEGWKRAPAFEARIWGDLMIGRGTIDMKALTVCQLVAFVEIAKTGRKPAHDLVFLATAEEEQGSRLGMQWLLANRPDLFEGVAYGITEGGITEIMGEQMTYFGIEIGGKQYVQTVVAAPTREALKESRIALEPFIFSRVPDRVLPEVRKHFAQLAPTRITFRELLADIDATIRNGQFWRLPPTYRALVQNNVVTGPPARAGDEWQMAVTLLNLPDEDPDRRVAWLRNTVAPSGARVREILSREGPVPLSPSDTRLFELLAAEARARYKVQAGVQVLYRSASDSRFLRTRGIAAYGVSPYPVTYYQSITIHQPDESITIGSFQEGIAYLRDVVRAWAFE
ncbi:MAG TPA: M20/M25/M40 family metallo-hydrolase [Thermoanaerobaculia bacterium]|jgi:acetylornithine deacetylase/succinyl-diaminopimelate desuccinylase-like protein|nr:M20/M25/M40 family metallo-hydrolase [Thermoanaerobaculia bacterium]